MNEVKITMKDSDVIKYENPFNDIEILDREYKINMYRGEETYIKTDYVKRHINIFINGRIGERLGYLKTILRDEIMYIVLYHCNIIDIDGKFKIYRNTSHILRCLTNEYNTIDKAFKEAGVLYDKEKSYMNEERIWN